MIHHPALYRTHRERILQPTPCTMIGSLDIVAQIMSDIANIRESKASARNGIRIAKENPEDQWQQRLIPHYRAMLRQFIIAERDLRTILEGWRG